MTSPRTGPRRARLASVLAALALAVPLAAAVSDPAAAADPTAQVTVTDAEIRDGTVTLRGSVTNSGTEPLTQVTVSLWRSTELLLSPQAINNALSATATTPGTSRVIEDANRARIVTDSDTLPPGESRTFTVSGTLERLGMRAPDATWWAGVDATGRIGTRRVQTVGSARTLVTRATTPPSVATVVELSAPPRQLKKNLFLTDDLAAEVTTGRLAQLLTAVETRHTDWVVDPSLLTELEDMADGYRVQTTDGSVSGTGEQAAAAWLTRLLALPPDRGATELFGSPDLAGLSRVGNSVLIEATSASTRATSLSSLATIAVLGDPDAAAALALASAQRTDSIVAVDAVAPATRVEVNGTDLTVATTEPQPPVTSPLLADTELTRDAARTAMVRALGAQVHWVRTPDALDADTTGLPASLKHVSLSDIMAGAATPWAPKATAGPIPSSLDATHLHRIMGLRERMTAYAGAAPESGIAEFVDAQTARSASRWWLADTPGQAAWLAGIERRVALPEGDMVSLDATGRFSMTGATSEFPVTVTNHLMDPITVVIVAETDNPQRIRLREPDPVAIAPGASSTVLLQAEASGSGVVRARVHAQTTDGHRLTPDREIAVETTNFGIIGWVIVIASGVVLVGTTAHRIRQARGQRKGEDG